VSGGAPDPARVASLFDEVVDLDPAERARALEAACAGEPALRSAVERLVKHDRAAGRGFLDEPVARLGDALAGAAEGAPLPAPSAPAPEASPRLGRFYLLRKLGEGGMGVVYVGYDEALDRRVAIKLLRPTATSRAWLLREGKALGRLMHPHVVTVHEVGEHDGRLFLAMELVEGGTLRAWLAERPRSFEEILAVFVQAGRGLAASHAAGLVHRDFKPDNVLVGKDGGARVVDFGIAALAGAAPPAEGSPDVRPSPGGAGPPEPPLTQPGAIAGTPGFIAPELLRGERATAASDQWSFCVALYRAVYGAAPFPDRDLAALLRAAAPDPAAPPPRREGVPAWLGPLVLRGLASEPAARHPSMEALLDAITRRLPRDPELDPAAVADERRILAAVLVLLPLAIIGALLALGPARALGGAWGLVRFAAFNLAVGVGVVALLRRRLARNRYGRRLAALFVGAGAAMMAHRLVAARVGLSVPQTLLGDLVVLATLNGAAAVTAERWLAVPSALLLACAAVGTSEPGWAVPLFGIAMVGTAAAIFAVWGRRG
jgi:serine/threonine-protein kinase